MAKIKTKINYPELKVINTSTGEIESAVCSYKTEDIDVYIMFFLNQISWMMNLDGNVIKVLVCCWKYSSYNPTIGDANRFMNGKAFKSFVRQEGLDISDSVIDNAISKLCKKELIIRECKGQYLLNPKYFFKGTLSQRSKLKTEIILN